MLFYVGVVFRVDENILIVCGVWIREGVYYIVGYFYSFSCLIGGYSEV